MPTPQAYGHTWGTTPSALGAFLSLCSQTIPISDPHSNCHWSLTLDQFSLESNPNLPTVEPASSQPSGPLPRWGEERITVTQTATVLLCFPGVWAAQDGARGWKGGAGAWDSLHLWLSF